MPTLNWIGKDRVVNHHLSFSIYSHEKCFFDFHNKCIIIV